MQIGSTLLTLMLGFDIRQDLQGCFQHTGPSTQSADILIKNRLTSILWIPRNKCELFKGVKLEVSTWRDGRTACVRGRSRFWRPVTNVPFGSSDFALSNSPLDAGAFCQGIIFSRSRLPFQWIHRKTNSWIPIAQSWEKKAIGFVTAYSIPPETRANYSIAASFKKSGICQCSSAHLMNIRANPSDRAQIRGRTMA